MRFFARVYNKRATKKKKTAIVTSNQITTVFDGLSVVFERIAAASE